jgi:hypothetical protein
MSNSVKLRTTTLVSQPKRVFNPKNREDLIEYKHYVQKGTWKSGVCPFQLQWPYLSIPHMINDIVVRHYLTKEFK